MSVIAFRLEGGSVLLIPKDTRWATAYPATEVQGGDAEQCADAFESQAKAIRPMIARLEDDGEE